MDPIKLTAFNALSSPADLWIVPDIQTSKWTQEIDYYLNFQITKSQGRVKKNLDPNLEKIISNESVVPTVNSSSGPLMIVPQNNLPAKCILYLGKNESPTEWLKKAYAIWSSLKSPSIKLFLPQGLTNKDIQSLWTDLGDTSLSFIEE